MPVIDLVPSDSDLPKSASCVVIGGGIAGVSTALELAERGIDTVLLEKGEIAAEQSSRNWGWCRQMGRDPREIPLIIESLKLWRGMNERVGADTGFTECGIAYLALDDEEVEEKKKWFRANVGTYKLKTRLIGAKEVADLLPPSTRAWKGALYTPDDGRAEPFKAVPAMAKAARQKGARIFTRCAARGLERKAGRISGVVTEKGTIACDTVIVAGGAWTRRFCHNMGIEFPQLTVINSVLRTSPLETGSNVTFSGDRFAVRKRADGGFTLAHNRYSVAEIVPDSFRLLFKFLPSLRLAHRELKFRIGQRFIDEARLKRRWSLDEVSPFEIVRILDPAPVKPLLEDAMQGLRQAFPIFEKASIAESWAGAIDATPDAVPVISAVDNWPGLFIASGFSGHGFGLGPGAGKLMAEIVTGETPCVDPSPFRYSRYFDGSNPKPTTGV